MGWLVIGAWVVAYDLWALRTNRSTLTAQFARAPKVVTIPVVAFVCAHLLDRIPRRWDDLHIAAGALTPDREG